MWTLLHAHSFFVLWADQNCACNSQLCYDESRSVSCFSHACLFFGMFLFAGGACWDGEFEEYPPGGDFRIASWWPRHAGLQWWWWGLTSCCSSRSHGLVEFCLASYHASMVVSIVPFSVASKDLGRDVEVRLVTVWSFLWSPYCQTIFLLLCWWTDFVCASAHQAVVQILPALLTVVGCRLACSRSPTPRTHGVF